MNNRYLKLQKVLSTELQSNDDIIAYSLESFAKEIDYLNQTELLTKLILDHSAIAKRLDRFNKELSHSREILAEAQAIALLGRWDIDSATGSMVWSESMYSILEIDKSTPATLELFLSFVYPEDLEQVTKMFRDMFVTRALDNQIQSCLEKQGDKNGASDLFQVQR